MKYPIAIAALTACWLTAAPALGQYDDSRFMAEGDAMIAAQQHQAAPVKQYDPEAAVAAGIKPSAPIPPRQDGWANANEARRATDRYNQELERYHNALERWEQQEEERRQNELRQRQPKQQIEQQRQAVQATTDQDASMASRILAGQRYPQLGDPNSDLTKKYLEIAKRLADAGNPLVNEPNAAERIADMAAAELKISPVK